MLNMFRLCAVDGRADCIWDAKRVSICATDYAEKLIQFAFEYVADDAARYENEDRRQAFTRWAVRTLLHCRDIEYLVLSYFKWTRADEYFCYTPYIEQIIPRKKRESNHAYKRRVVLEKIDFLRTDMMPTVWIRANRPTAKQRKQLLRDVRWWLVQNTRKTRARNACTQHERFNKKYCCGKSRHKSILTTYDY